MVATRTGLGDLLRRDAEAGNLILARTNLQFRTGQGAFGADVCQDATTARRLDLAECPRLRSDRLLVRGQEVEGQFAFGAVVELQDANIGNADYAGEDIRLNIPLRSMRPCFLIFGRYGPMSGSEPRPLLTNILTSEWSMFCQDDAHGGPAQFEVTLGRGTAENENAFDAIDVASMRPRSVRGGGVSLIERRIRRQFDGQHDARGIVRRQEAAGHRRKKHDEPTQETRQPRAGSRSGSHHRRWCRVTRRVYAFISAPSLS